MSKNTFDHEPAKTSSLNGFDPTYVKLTNNRILFMVENFTEQMATELSALLLYLDKQDPDKLIEIYIHSNGGSSAALVHIYDIIQMISAPIKTVCIGKCFSAGAVLLAVGAKGERYAFKNSKIMIHGIQSTFPIPGHTVSHNQNFLDFLKGENDKVMKILAHHSGQSLEKVKEDCSKDVWMSPEQALEYGIIDKIV
jgi:ATP-dependent Clp protease, protease subunit